MKIAHNPRDLFFDQLRSIYSMEVQICESLPQLVALCSNESLRQLIERHGQQNYIHIAEISEIFQRYEESLADDMCKAIAGIIEGGVCHLRHVKDPSTRDLMIIAHCLRIEHYEMAAYEITALLAVRLGMIDEQELFKEFLADEKDMAAALLEWEPFLYEIAESAPKVSGYSHDMSGRQNAMTASPSLWILVKSWFVKTSEWQR